MDSKHREFETFVSLHGNKASCTDEPLAHVRFPEDAHDDPLTLMSKEDICSAFDTSSNLVRWFLTQLNTFDYQRQKLLALVFDRSTIISNVYWVKRIVDS